VNDDAVRDIKRALADPMQVCERLGLLADRRAFQRQGGGVLIRCPVHDDRSPSCSVQHKHGVLLWKCHACDASGDVLTLVAVVHGLSMSGDDFRQVLIVAAELGGLHRLVVELESGERRPRPEPVRRPEPAPEPERDYPPIAEVEALWAASGAFDDEARAWATGRGLDADVLVDFDLARQLPKSGPIPRWASFRGRSWRETGHRVIVPVFDADGAQRSLRAIRVVEGETPKRLPPGGHKASGLVMACEFALAMLRGTYAPRRVLIVEGEPDFLTVSLRREPYVFARMGITSGGWTPAFAAKIPPDADVFVCSHADQAGEKYAASIRATLSSQRMYRWQPEAA
jgi:hypothetical protein